MLHRAIVFTALAALIVAGGSVLSGRASAQNLRPAVVAVVDTQAVLASSSVGKDIKDQVEKIRLKYQAEIDKRTAELKAEEDELKRQQTILSQQAFAEKQREFNRKRLAVQQYVQQVSRIADGAVQRALSEVQRTIGTILSEMQPVYGYHIVVDSQTLMYASPDLNVSKDVLSRLNERLPKMPVQVPQQ